MGPEGALYAATDAKPGGDEMAHRRRVTPPAGGAPGGAPPALVGRSPRLLQRGAPFVARRAPFRGAFVGAVAPARLAAFAPARAAFSPFGGDTAF